MRRVLFCCSEKWGERRSQESPRPATSILSRRGYPEAGVRRRSGAGGGEGSGHLNPRQSRRREATTPPSWLCQGFPRPHNLTLPEVEGWEFCAFSSPSASQVSVPPPPWDNHQPAAFYGQLVPRREPSRKQKPAATQISNSPSQGPGLSPPSSQKEGPALQGATP